MNIDIGQLCDLPMIMTMIDSCIEDLYNNKIYQWNNFYPSIDLITQDIKNQHLYIIKNDNSCLAVIVINDIFDIEWNSVSWSKNYNNPLAVHRLIVNPDNQNQGIGRELMKFALKYAEDNNYDSIRFDVYSGNSKLIKTYENMNCKKRGEVCFPYRELPFFCYEYIL